MMESMESPEPWERSGSWAFQLALCLLGPLFFLSYAFTLLAPLPSLYLLVGKSDRRLGRMWWAIALFLGTALAAVIHGLPGALGFLLLVSLPSLVLGEVLLWKKSVEKAISLAFLAVVAAGVLAFWIVASSHGKGLGPAVSESIVYLEQTFKSTAEHLLEAGKNDWAETTVTSLKQIVETPRAALMELPGLLASGLLLLCVLPCLALIRWNPKGFLHRAGIGRDFLRKWKTPEWLVWPAILCVTLMLFELEIFSTVARNCVKPLLVIYFFQGMSILAYFLDSLRLRGPFRVPIYALGMVMYPMVVSFGFFDLWLNFRHRHKPIEAEEDKES
ncbi:MAG: DUF2232 domain-containing protein [Bacteriovoracia bacterium]